MIAQSINGAELSHAPHSPPLYAQVKERLEQLVLDMPLGHEDMLPPEPALMEAFGVSRGTVRRAIAELQAEGLLFVVRGKGTIINEIEHVRRIVWEQLCDVALPDARFDHELRQFIPDFVGSVQCTSTIIATRQYQGSATIFITPDNSLRGLRQQALSEGKALIVPTYGIRRGFVLLDGDRLNTTDVKLASTLDGMEDVGEVLSLEAIKRLPRLGLIVTGAVAVTRAGLHIGGGQGYFDLEWGLLTTLGTADQRTTVMAVVHDTQVVEAELSISPKDCPLDEIVTPTQHIVVDPPRPKPESLSPLLTARGRAEGVSYLAELTELGGRAGTRRGGVGATLSQE